MSDRSVNADDELIGKLVADRYRVVRKLGQGGMGTVYHAVHEKLRKPVALKVLSSTGGNDKEVVARFEREAIASANLKHPNIAEASDFGKLPDGALYLVMELIEGKTARALLHDARGGLPVDRALRILSQVAAALARAHAGDVVHRDLKPDNIIVFDRDEERDVVKVIDFGIARIRSALLGAGGKSITVAGAVFGTPEYMAPEQVMGQAVDGRADQYAFGVLTFELLTGRVPFTDDEDVTRLLMKHVSAPVPSTRDVAPHLPPDVSDVIARMLAKRPDERYPTIEQAAAALEAAIGVPASPAIAPPVSVAGGGTLYMQPSARTSMPSASSPTPAPVQITAPAVTASGLDAVSATPAPTTGSVPVPTLADAARTTATALGDVMRRGTSRLAVTSKALAGTTKAFAGTTAVAFKKSPVVAGGAAFAGLLVLVLVIVLIAHGHSSSLPSEVAAAASDWEDGAYAEASPKLRAELAKSAALSSDPELVRSVVSAVKKPDGRGALKALLDDTRLGRSPVMATALADIAVGEVSASRNGALRLLRGRGDLLAADQRARVAYRDADDCAALEAALNELSSAGTDRAKEDLERHRGGHCADIVRREEICGCQPAPPTSWRGKRK